MFRLLTENKVRPLWIVAALALLFAVFAAGPQAAQAQGSAWTAWYWDNDDLSGDPVVERLEGQPSIDVGLGSPADDVPDDNFSARWVNTIQVDEAGNFTFSATVDDGLRVYVDDELVIDDWEPQAEHTVSETVQLSAGSHVVRVEYFDSRDTALLDFNWGPAGADAPDTGDDDAGDDMDDEDVDFSADVVTATTTVNLRIRSGPSLSDEILDVLPAGSVVGFTGFMDESGQWVLVDAEAGPTGWVSAQFLSNVPDDLSVPGEAQPEEGAEDGDMASVTVEDQALGDDATVTIPSVTSEVEGWLVIHADSDGSPGPVIGQTSVSAGTTENVSVEIDEAAATQTLHAMLHVDTGLEGVYEFPDDDPPALANDQVVVQPFTLTDWEEDAEFPADVVTATTTVNLRIRSGPSLSDDILTTLPAGTVVGFTGFTDPSGQWVLVDALGGPTGWVSAQFLSNVPDDLSVYAGDS
jgi:uncharacterized protein YraI